MLPPKLEIKLSGGCIFYLESKLEFQISLERTFRIAQRINTKVRSILVRD